MNDSVKLPVTNEYGYYEIRLESIGGLGANLCGKLLGELGALYLKLNTLSFSSYGSEKRGSPVKAYIRWCMDDVSLRINSPVTHPHLLGIFHEGLISAYPVLSGISRDSQIVLNTPLSATEAAEKYNISTGTLHCIDALSIAMKCKSRINMVMLGALAKASGFVPLSMAEALCAESVGKKYPSLIEANLKGLRAGYENLSSLSLSAGTAPVPSNVVTDPGSSNSGSENYVWGYQNAPIGGVNPRIGSTISNDLSASREGYIPLFLPEKCIHCGLCDSACPDFVFQFLPGTYKGKPAMKNSGLDYTHCKGCLRCVAVCPTAALVTALERDYEKKPHERLNRDLLIAPPDYQKAGANSWITSDSYLTEKRVDGGIL